MPVIVQNSIVTLFKNIPFDADYENTTRWQNIAAQENYFASKSDNTAILNKEAFVLTNLQYARINRNQIKVQIPYADCYDVNYMRIHNPSPYEAKNWYCFVDKVDYINENTSLVTFHKDLMQTWQEGNDYVLGSCFVKREHADSNYLDEDHHEIVGYNIVPEQLELGEQVLQDKQEVFFNDFYIGVGVVPTTDMKQALGSWLSGHQVFCAEYDRMLQSHILLLFDISQTTEMNRLKSVLDEYNSHPEQILMIYAIPKDAVNYTSGSTYGSIDTLVWGESTSLRMADYLVSGSRATPKIVDYNPTVDNLDGYTPHNKKLFTYPFNMIGCVSSDGDLQTYRYEWFGSSATNRKFEIDFNLIPPINAECKPLSYRQNGSTSPLQKITPQYRTTLSCTVLGGWSNDNFRAWLQQNIGKFAVQATSLMITHTLGMGMAKTATAIGKAADTKIALEGLSTFENARHMGIRRDADLKLQEEKIKVDTIRGASNDIGEALCGAYSSALNNATAQGFKSSSLAFSNGIMGFTLMRLCCNKEYAKRIDQYFDAYGYACSQIKVPNTRARALWSYVETQDCKLNSHNMPTDDKEMIKNIYNRGVRIFNNIEPINNYITSAIGNTILE